MLQSFSCHTLIPLDASCRDTQLHPVARELVVILEAPAKALVVPLAGGFKSDELPTAPTEMETWTWTLQLVQLAVPVEAEVEGTTPARQTATIKAVVVERS